VNEQQNMTIAEARAAFERIVADIEALTARDAAEQIVDLLVSVSEFRSVMTKPGEDWDALRGAADETRSYLRRLITDRALKSMDTRQKALAEIADELRAIAREAHKSG